MNTISSYVCSKYRDILGYRIPLSILCLALCASAYAQTNIGLESRVLNSFNGLSSDHVKQTIEDKDGMIWFATTKGLNRYDGKNILQYKADKLNKKGIPHNDVRSLLVTQSGELWIGTQNGLVKKLNNDSFVEISNKTFGEDVFPSDQIIKLIQSKNGNIWVATQGGVVVISPDLKNHHTYSHSTGLDKEKSPASGIEDIFEDSFENVWITTWAGGLTIAISENPTDPHSYSFSSLNPEKLGLPRGVTFSNILQDEDDKIWLQEAYGVFYRLDFKGENLQKGLKEENLLLKKFDFGLFDDNEKAVLASCYIKGSGLFVSTLKGSWIIPMANMQGEPNSKPVISKMIDGLSIGQDTKEDIFIDSRNIAWISSNKGLFMYFGLVNSLFDKYPSYQSKITDNKTSGIFHDNSGTWLGTDIGLFIDNGKELVEIKYNNAQITSVISFEKTSDGKIWLGTLFGELYEIEKKANGFDIELHTIEGLNQYQGNNHIWKLLDMRDGNLWIGTHVGVYVYNRKSKATRKLSLHLLGTVFYDFNCFDLERGKNASVYISATGIGLITGYPDASKEGGYDYDIKIQGDLKCEMSSNVIFDIEVIDDQIWLAQNTGVEVYNIPLDSFYRIPKLDASVNSQVYSIISSNDRIWATTPTGMSSYSQKNNSIDNFNIIDGVIDNLSMLGHHKDANGDIFLAGSGGYHILESDKEYRRPDSTEIILSHLSINNVPVKIGGNDPVFNRPILTEEFNETESIRLSHSHKNIVINFSVQDFISPHQYEYSFILKGISEEWTDLGQEQRITFNQLPNHNFELGIKAMDQFGKYTETKFLSIEVVTPLWKKTNSIILLGILGILGIYFGMRYQKAKVIKRNLQLETSVEQRTMDLKDKNQKLEEYIESNMKLENFAHAASHDLKAPLLNISAFAGLLKKELEGKLTQEKFSYFDEIEKGTSRLKSLIDDILDYSKLNSEKIVLDNISVTSIIEEVLHSLSAMIAKKNAIIRFEKSDLFDQLLLDEIKISRVLQNLLTNALKFVPEDRNPEIKIYFDSDETSNYVRIKDNGIGISEKDLSEVFKSFKRVAHTSAYDGTGFGLTVSKKIMNLHNGDLLVTSEYGKTSTFSLQFPKNS